MKKNKLLILLVLLSVVLSMGCKKEPKKDIGVGPITTIDLTKSIQSSLVKEGKVLFESKCTMCHNLDQKMVGPALGNITNKRSPEWIMNMILNPDIMVKENEAAKNLLAEFNNIAMINQSLSKKEARALLEYFRENDKNN
jgi:cytochrome c